MKNIRIFGRLLLLAIMITPSTKANEISLPSIQLHIKDGIIGACTGIGLGVTTSLNIDLGRWIAKKIGEITKKSTVNYVPAIIIGIIIEAVALFGWEEVRAYFTLDSDISFWTHYGSASLITAASLYNKKWTALALLETIRKSIDDKYSSKKANPDSDSDSEEEEEYPDLP